MKSLFCTILLITFASASFQGYPKDGPKKRPSPPTSKRISMKAKAEEPGLKKARLESTERAFNEKILEAAKLFARKNGINLPDEDPLDEFWRYVRVVRAQGSTNPKVIAESALQKMKIEERLRAESAKKSKPKKPRKAPAVSRSVEADTVTEKQTGPQMGQSPEEDRQDRTMKIEHVSRDNKENGSNGSRTPVASQRYPYPMRDLAGMSTGSGQRLDRTTREMFAAMQLWENEPLPVQAPQIPYRSTTERVETRKTSPEDTTFPSPQLSPVNNSPFQLPGQPSRSFLDNFTLSNSLSLPTSDDPLNPRYASLPSPKHLPPPSPTLAPSVPLTLGQAPPQSSLVRSPREPEPPLTSTSSYLSPPPNHFPRISIGPFPSSSTSSPREPELPLTSTSSFLSPPPNHFPSISIGPSSPPPRRLSAVLLPVLVAHRHFHCFLAATPLFSTVHPPQCPLAITRPVSIVRHRLLAPCPQFWAVPSPISPCMDYPMGPCSLLNQLKTMKQQKNA